MKRIILLLIAVAMGTAAPQAVITPPSATQASQQQAQKQVRAPSKEELKRLGDELVKYLYSVMRRISGKKDVFDTDWHTLTFYRETSMRIKFIQDAWSKMSPRVQEALKFFLTGVAEFCEAKRKNFPPKEDNPFVTAPTFDFVKKRATSSAVGEFIWWLFDGTDGDKRFGDETQSPEFFRKRWDRVKRWDTYIYLSQMIQAVTGLENWLLQEYGGAVSAADQEAFNRVKQTLSVQQRLRQDI